MADHELRKQAQAPDRTCGAPGARKRARRVREAVQGNGPVDKTGTAPWTDFTTHISTAMRRLIAARDWLHVIQLPAYAPDLNPTESVWSHVKRSLGNLATTGVDHLAAVVRNRLKRIQYRSDLLDSFLAQTGLILEPEPP